MVERSERTNIAGLMVKEGHSMVVIAEREFETETGSQNLLTIVQPG